jgi:DNA polymerase elongation subunit (family B)
MEDGSLIFPRDNIERDYFITGWELLAATETGALENPRLLKKIRHHELLSFADYINHFYELRQKAKRNGDKENDLFSKLLMNSLYGKFGSNPENYSAYMLVEPEHIATAENDGYKFGGMLGDNAMVTRDLRDGEACYFNVATSASITGFVRAYLWRALCAAGGVLYCDTDSIACSDPGALVRGNELGQWKDEGAYNKAAIAGKKLYAFREITGEWKTRSKGVRLTARQIMKVARGGIVTYAGIVPTFSLKKAPFFTARKVQNTV